MAQDWSNITLRFLGYADLMILFGVPLFALYALGPNGRRSWIGRRYALVCLVAAVIGAVLALFGLVAMGMQMTGATDYSAITSHVLAMILTRTGAGIAWAVRILALAACVIAAASMRNRSCARFVVLACSGAAALATLAWTGHGAMDDGPKGYLHLVSDMLHLLAAGAWAGALVGFLILSVSPQQHAGASAVDTLSSAASGFARTGALIVGTLVVTGAVNYALILGPSLGGLVSTVYGRLLGAKLVIFAAMLGCAAANRNLLAPRLEAAVAAGGTVRAARMLRRSMWTEAGFALIVLALVAWLGTLAPDA